MGGGREGDAGGTPHYTESEGPACLLAMPPDVMWDTERATHHWSARLTDEAHNARLQFAIKLSDSRIDAFMLAGYIPESIEAFDPCTEGHHQLWGGRAALPTLHLKRAAQLCNASRRSLVVDWDGLEQLFTCEASISLGF